MVKITALLVLKCNQDGSDPVILANASDPTCFGFLTVNEFIVFASRTIAKRSLPSQRLSVKHQDQAIWFICITEMDCVHWVLWIITILSEVHFHCLVRSWMNKRRSLVIRGKLYEPIALSSGFFLSEALERFQDPAEADGLLKIQRLLDETKIILIILKNAKKTNQCCTIL